MKNSENDTPLDCNCQNGGHFDLHFLHLGDLQYDLHFFQPGFQFSTLENLENDTLFDYTESYIKIVKMGVTLTSTFLLGDLQYDVHTFQTWI